jgi:hypothetical protein
MHKITVTGADRTLFHVALRHLNDATEWVRIAQASGLSDPMIVGVMTLTIPNLSSKATGGIPQL